MNLAEIRKKAIGTLKPDDHAISHASETSCADSDGSDVESFPPIDQGGMIDDASEFDFYPDAGVDESSFPDTFEAESMAAADEIPPSAENFVEPALDFTATVDDLPEQEIDELHHLAPTGSCRLAPVSGEEPVRAPKVRHPSYDPLSILLAGRQAAEEGAELSVEEEGGRFSDDVEEYLCFKVADEEYALSIMAIKEIIKPREVTEVPRMPRFVSGVISLRGIIIPIMDMRLRLSLPVRETTGRERILVLKTSNGLCGVLVDEVIQVVRIGSSAIEGPPTILDGVDREFVMGLGRHDNRMLILLNLESILDLNVH